MNRASFIRYLTTLVVGSQVPFFSSCRPGSEKRALGIITGAFRDLLDTDPENTLNSLAEMGYSYLEYGGVSGNTTVKDFESMLRNAGLRSVAGGSTMDKINANRQQYIDECMEAGKEYLVSYWPWMRDIRSRFSFDDVKQTCEIIVALGDQCHASGIKFAVHNHDMEFVDFDGQNAWDYFITNTDPEKVTFEMDLFWVTKAGADPVKIINKYPGRFELWHLKDITGADNKPVTPGEGTIDFPTLFSLSEVAGLRYPIVELAQTDNPLNDAKKGIQHLRRCC